MAKTAYLSGPMRNKPYFNMGMFQRVAGELRRDGWIVSSPLEHDQESMDLMQFPTGSEDEAKASGFSLAKALTWDFSEIMRHDNIICLPGWERSNGCLWELIVAHCTNKALWEYQGYRHDEGYTGVLLSRLVPPAVVTDPVNCGRRYGV